MPRKTPLGKDPFKDRGMPRADEHSPTLIRRLIDTGLGALIAAGEEGGRTIVSPLTLPKEIISYLVNQIERGKTEVVALFGREFKRFLEATDISEEVVKAMSQMRLEIKAEITFTKADEKNEDGEGGRVKTRVRIKSKTP
ncbi:MAG: hypothetical protein C4523_05605 [Myxococcales bacterium]|nr:MAG: hypothetical protein C4523_05605 [Myxococcales bacterium]